MTTRTAPTTIDPTAAREQQPVAGCGEESCDVTLIQDVDVYCHSHDRFLPLAGSAPKRLRPMLAFAWRATICLAFPLAAAVDNPLPVFLAAAVLGAVIVAFPLRRSATLAAYAVAGWSVACGGALLLQAADPARVRLTWTILLTVTAFAWLVHFTQEALEREDAGPTGALVASGFAVTPAALTVWAGTQLPVTRQLIDLPGGATVALVVLAAGAPVLALLTAACGAIARTGDSALPYQYGPFRRPERPQLILAPRRSPRRPVSGAHRLPERIGQAVLAFADTVAFAAHTATVLVGNVLLRAWYWTKVGFFWLANWTWCWADAFAAILADATHLAAAATRNATRMIPVPVAALAAAAWSTLQFARNNTTYLTEGSVPALFTLLGAGALAALALHITWIALCHQPLLPAARSAGHTASISGANGLILIAIGGWTIGLFGTFHHGPIRVGWVTLTATLVLAITSVWTYQRHRNPRLVLQ